MKYITFLAGEFNPLCVLFSPHQSHEDIARRIGLPVMGAGFVRIDNGKATVSGFVPCLNTGAGNIDALLIEHDLSATADHLPADETANPT